MRATQEVNLRNRKQNKHKFYSKIKSISKINCPEPIETTTLNHFKYKVEVDKENSFVTLGYSSLVKGGFLPTMIKYYNSGKYFLKEIIRKKTQLLLKVLELVLII